MGLKARNIPGIKGQRFALEILTRSVLALRAALRVRLPVSPLTPCILQIPNAWTPMNWSCSRKAVKGRGIPQPNGRGYAAKALDSLEDAHAPGIAGGCRPKAVKHPPGVPSGERCINRCAPDNSGTMSARTRPSADAGPAGRPRRGLPEGPSETPSGEESRPEGRHPGRRGESRFFPRPPAPWGWGGGWKNRIEYGFLLAPQNEATMRR